MPIGGSVGEVNTSCDQRTKSKRLVKCDLQRFTMLPADNRADANGGS